MQTGWVPRLDCEGHPMDIRTRLHLMESSFEWTRTCPNSSPWPSYAIQRKVHYWRRSYHDDWRLQWQRNLLCSRLFVEFDHRPNLAGIDLGGNPPLQPLWSGSFVATVVPKVWEMANGCHSQGLSYMLRKDVCDMAELYDPGQYSEFCAIVKQ